MTTIYNYKKMDGTTRNITVDPSKTQEFRPMQAFFWEWDTDDTHMRVWDIENEGWRTLIMANIIDTTYVCISDTFYNTDETVEGEEILTYNLN